MSTTLLKKIGASDILGQVAGVVRSHMEVGQVIPAYSVAGVCNALETGVSSYGEWSRFIGDFNAINYVTGESFRSEKTHIPKVLEAVLLRDLEDMKGTIKELQHSTVTKLTSEIEFAFKVDLKRLQDDDKGGVSYEYITTPLTQIKENDRISHLTAMLPPATKLAAIEAPAPEVKETPANAPKKAPANKK